MIVKTLSSCNFTSTGQIGKKFEQEARGSEHY